MNNNYGYVDEYSRIFESSGMILARKKAIEYYSMAAFGLIMTIFGVILIFGQVRFRFRSFYIYVFVFGIGLAFLLKGIESGSKWGRKAKNSNIIYKYLKKLPEGYYIFSDVKIPTTRIHIDHVVIGPNGIFVIETKNLTGNYCIKGNQWYKKSKTDKYYKIRKSPGLQLLDNTIGLKIFLKNRGISTTEVHINAIVAFINRNLKIIEKTKHYNVLTPDMIPVFILNQKKVQNLEIIEKAKSELKKHTTRLFSKDAEFE